MDQLLAEARQGNTRALARLLSWAEDSDPRFAKEIEELTPGHAHIIGMTGSPGVGKSTLTSALIGEFRRRQLTVAVLAVDPSSPFTGGALLGDRIRMQDHSLDTGVYIRSMSARGQLGGLAAATHTCARVLAGCDFDFIILETVGVGQSEVDIVRAADTTVVVHAPGLGDSVQSVKAGILEIADIFVVNKSDREGADKTVRELKALVDLTENPGWVVPVVQTVGTDGTGVADLAQAINEHREWLISTGELGRRQTQRALDEIRGHVVAEANRALDSHADQLAKSAEDVAAGRVTPESVARDMARAIGLTSA